MAHVPPGSPPAAAGDPSPSHGVDLLFVSPGPGELAMAMAGPCAQDTSRQELGLVVAIAFTGGILLHTKPELTRQNSSHVVSVTLRQSPGLDMAVERGQ